VLVEIQQRDRLAVHMNIAESVDDLLRGYPLPPEIRTRDAEGRIQIEKAALSAGSRPESEFRIGTGTTNGPRRTSYPSAVSEPVSTPYPASARTPLQPVRVYPFGVARNRLIQAAKRLGVPAAVARDIGEANVLVTLRSYYRDRQQAVVDAEHRGMPIYVLRANTASQIEQFLSDLFNLSEVQPLPAELESVAQQTQAAIAAVLNGERWVDLPAGPAAVRRIQHEMARQVELVSHSYGKEPRRHVRIFRE
jgi:hypothetical protein